MRIKRWIDAWRQEEELVATFGQARLVRTHTGRYELRGGTPDDLQRAKEWISLFLHEACPIRVPHPPLTRP